MQGIKVFLSVVAHRWIRVSVSQSGALISVMVEASRSAELYFCPYFHIHVAVSVSDH